MGFLSRKWIWSKPATVQCQYLQRAQRYTLPGAACKETCYSTFTRDQERNELCSSLPAQQPLSPVPRLLSPFNLLQGSSGSLQSRAWVLETHREDDPSLRLRPHLPLQAGAWALGHCSAPTWCETVPLWHSACISPGRRLLPPRPACRHKPLTDPHCSCGGESMRASGGQWDIGAGRPQLPRELTHSCGVKTA